MIEQKELMQGNLVTVNELAMNYEENKKVQPTFRVKTIFRKTVSLGGCIMSESDSCIEPILITPEWLERFGFEDNGLTGSIRSYRLWGMSKEDEGNLILHKYTFLLDKDGIIQKQRASIFGAIFSHIKYVHQLQNLFLATTGEKLELKQ